MKDLEYRQNIVTNDKGEYGLIRYSDSYQTFAAELMIIVFWVLKNKIVDPNVDDYWKEHALERLKNSTSAEDPLGKAFLTLMGKLNSRVFDNENYDEILAQLLICRMVDNYLTYLRDILAEVVLVRPEILKSKEVERLDFILSYNRYEDLIQAIVEKKIEELSYKSFDDISTFFEDRLGIKPFVEFDLDKLRRKIRERNLLVHNRGLINRRFAMEFGLGPDQIGKNVGLSFDDVMPLWTLLYSEVVFLDSKISHKFPIKTTKDTLL